MIPATQESGADIEMIPANVKKEGVQVPSDPEGNEFIMKTEPDCCSKEHTKTLTRTEFGVPCDICNKKEGLIRCDHWSQCCAKSHTGCKKMLCRDHIKYHMVMSQWGPIVESLGCDECHEKHMVVKRGCCTIF